MPDGQAAAFDLSEFNDANFRTAIGVSSVAVSGVHQYLFGYLEQVGARTIVEESEYVDGDYLDDYASYYSRCFEEIPRLCKRLHFFETSFGRDEFLVGLTESDGDSVFQAGYLGFIVVRPLPDALVGRTVLATYPGENGRRRYPATREYDVSLAGIPLKVRALAFQSQDTVVAACATVALWCAFHLTSTVFGSRLPRPAEITSAASGAGNEGRVFPNQGLDLKQVCAAIRSVDLEPELFRVSRAMHLLSLLRAHLDAGIPCILIVMIEGQGLHAITLAGYSVRDSVHQAHEGVTNPLLPMCGQRIDGLYGHDDQVGPFARLRVAPAPQGLDVPVVLESTGVSAWAGTRLLPHSVVVPVYNKIRVTFDQIRSRLLGLNRLVSAALFAARDVEWDIQLTTVNDQKMRLRNNESIDKDEKLKVLMMAHPKYIWRAKLRCDGGAQVLLLADATGTARSSSFYAAIWFAGGARAGLAKVIASVDPAVIRRLLGDDMAAFFAGESAHFGRT